MQDWHTCATEEELNRWRVAIAALIDAAKAEAEHEIRTLREQLEEKQAEVKLAEHGEDVADDQLAATRAALIALRDKWLGQKKGWLTAQPNYSKSQVFSECADALTQAAGLPDAQERP